MGYEPDPSRLDEIRSAFSSGQSAAGENLLAAALDDGLPWDVVTRAVAEGVANRYGSFHSGAQPGGASGSIVR